MSAPTPPSPHFPDDLRGVWQRTVLQRDTESPEPVTDRSTWVRWLQTSAWHADLRVPEQCLQDRLPQSLHDLAPARLSALTDQQGHAGVTRCEALPEGLVCTWMRRTDYQPPGLHPDEGWLMSDHPDRLIEVGVHEDYNEVWERLPDSTGRFVALAGLDPNDQDNGDRLLLAGRYLMHVRDQRPRWPRGMTAGFALRDVLLAQPERAHEWLDCEISFGALGEGGWQIERSTLPACEGLQRPLRVRRMREDLAHVEVHGLAQRWCVLEWSCDDNLLDAR